MLEKARAEKYTGHVSNLNVEHRNDSGDSIVYDGPFGTIEEVRVKIDEDHKPERQPNLILKSFKGERFETAQDQAGHSAYIYGKLRKMLMGNEATKKNVNHILPSTYRIVSEGDKERTKILITDYNKDGLIAVSHNQNISKYEKGVVIESINEKSLGSLLSNIADVILIASKNGLRIQCDAYFMLIPKDGGSDIDIDFSVVDITKVTEENIEKKGSQRMLIVNNITQAVIGILANIERFMPKESYKNSVRIVKEWELKLDEASRNIETEELSKIKERMK